MLSIWGNRSSGRSRHQATAGLVVFARGPKPQVPHFLHCTTCILGSGNLHRTSPGCQRGGRKDGRRRRKRQHWRGGKRGCSVCRQEGRVQHEPEQTRKRVLLEWSIPRLRKRSHWKCIKYKHIMNLILIKTETSTCADKRSSAEKDLLSHWKTEINDSPLIGGREMSNSSFPHFLIILCKFDHRWTVVTNSLCRALSAFFCKETFPPKLSFVKVSTAGKMSGRKKSTTPWGRKEMKRDEAKKSKYPRCWMAVKPGNHYNNLILIVWLIKPTHTIGLTRWEFLTFRSDD